MPSVVLLAVSSECEIRASIDVVLQASVHSAYWLAANQFGWQCRDHIYCEDFNVPEVARPLNPLTTWWKWRLFHSKDFLLHSMKTPQMITTKSNYFLSLKLMKKAISRHSIRSQPPTWYLSESWSNGHGRLYVLLVGNYHSRALSARSPVEPS